MISKIVGISLIRRKKPEERWHVPATSCFRQRFKRNWNIIKPKTQAIFKYRQFGCKMPGLITRIVPEIMVDIMDGIMIMLYNFLSII
jgi:hypothetical protein